MVPRQRVIIDTDPGIDDIFALLLAFSSSPEELEIPLVSITHGNVDVQSCLRNVVTLFHIVEKEQSWRASNGLAQGFETIEACKPIVAVGADSPLEDQLIMADFFHGRDGLGGSHTSHPHFTPSETWRTMFQASDKRDSAVDTIDSAEIETARRDHHLFTPTLIPAHKEILRLLAENPPDTIIIIAIGPLTNLALAAAEDPKTFLRAKEVVVMGGAIKFPGNITPLAEFNTHADAVAAARVYALTSQSPASTMPPRIPNPPKDSPELPSYPPSLADGPLKLTLFPLDITSSHRLTHSLFTSTMSPLLAKGSPLAQWSDAFMSGLWARAKADGEDGLVLHDPLCVWYTIAHPSLGTLGAASNVSDSKKGGMSNSEWEIRCDVDIRVETAGQWSRGACITDGRGRAKVDSDMPGDRQGWLSKGKGNRLRQAMQSPGDVRGEGFAKILMKRVFDV